tara:strand:- start:57 stop:632 length:576 start_codon:yes stop_codon:yes gene_type:complete
MFFSIIYKKILIYSKNKHSKSALCLTSFIEAIFFPIPPDLLLLPMCLALPNRSFYYAFLTTLFSVLGGVCAYWIGFFVFDLYSYLLVDYGYQKQVVEVKTWFKEWGIWIIFLASFTPIPYKIFTIVAGTMAMPFFGFIFASIIGRGLRFFLVALFVTVGGEKLQKNITKHIELLGWFCIILITLYIFFKLV